MVTCVAGSRPPPVPIEKLKLQSVKVNTVRAEVPGHVVSGYNSQRSSGGTYSARISPSGTARSFCGGDSASARSPINSERKPSITLSERRAIEERRMEIESVRGL